MPGRSVPRADQAAIWTRGLTRRYGDLVAVDHLDLAVRPGEIFGLLGPNGAGKTTTILMLLGLTEPTEGEARVLGLDPTRHPLEVKRRVGYVPDSVGFYEPMTGRENLRYTARLNGIDSDEAERRIDQVLDRVGLGADADRPVREYSRGMLQRLGIADVLLKEPDVFILDEPTTAIDPEGVAEVLELIRSLARERGAAVLLSSHLLHQVQAVCDRVGIFVRGRMVAQGPMAELARKLATGPVTIEVGADGAVDVEAVLRSVPGVRDVRRDERDGGLWVVTADRDLRPELARALSEAGAPLHHLRRRGGELDEIYRRYFQEAERGDGR
ncbi:MAG TPA: ABC transporter ATP-binding protein [Actinomycetota bacterium]|nr:ABC transporter ATP-binding protein [Actinomycetota bacterium]